MDFAGRGTSRGGGGGEPRSHRRELLCGQQPCAYWARLFWKPAQDRLLQGHEHQGWKIVFRNQTPIPSFASAREPAFPTQVSR